MTEKKRRRQESLVLAVRKEPFLTDEALALKGIDLDIEACRREEVIQHVYELYGRERAAQVNVVECRGELFGKPA